MNHVNNTKNRYKAILLCSIFAIQTVIVSILHNLNIILKEHSAVFTVFFYIIVFFSTIPQAKLSDEYGRKKHLLISSYIVMLSGILVSGIMSTTDYVLHETQLLLSIIPLLLLGVGGNFIAIVRGCVASLGTENLRSAIGYTTSMIGFGWIAVNMMSLVLSPLQLIIITLLMQFTCTVIIIKYYNQKDKVMGNKKPIVIIKNSYYSIIRTILFAAGLWFVLIYCFTEIVFYNIYIENESNVRFLYKKLTGISMGIAYFFGILTQFIINPSDTKSIKFGMILSCTASLIILGLKFSFIERLAIPVESFISLKITDILQFVFAFGFGYFVPSIFSLISKKTSKHHYSWVFGLLDATTAALLLSSAFIYFISIEAINNVTFFVLNVIILFLALIFSFLCLNQKSA